MHETPRHLVERAANGDHDAFTLLVHQHSARMHGLAVLILRDRTRAEDAVQDAFVRAWRDLPRLRDVDRFDAWIRRLVVNACHDEGRRLGRRRGETELLPHHEAPFADSAEGVADRDEIGRGFARLSPEQRTAIVLRYYADLPTSEAATVMGVPDGTYKSKLHRAMQALAAGIAADARTPDTNTRGRPA